MTSTHPRQGSANRSAGEGCGTVGRRPAISKPTHVGAPEQLGRRRLLFRTGEMSRACGGGRCRGRAAAGSRAGRPASAGSRTPLPISSSAVSSARVPSRSVTTAVRKLVDGDGGDARRTSVSPAQIQASTMTTERGQDRAAGSARDRRDGWPSRTRPVEWPIRRSPASSRG